jgi:hypothetical protein
VGELTPRDPLLGGIFIILGASKYIANLEVLTWLYLGNVKFGLKDFDLVEGRDISNS